MDEGYDIVIGSRFVDEKKSFSMRMIGSRMIAAAIRLTTGVHVADPTSGMRMFNQKMIREFALNLNYGPEPVSYTHLDVYKRQGLIWLFLISLWLDDVRILLEIVFSKAPGCRLRQCA